MIGSRRPKIKLKRDGQQGRVRILARRGPDPDLETVDRNVHERVDPITESLHLRSDVRVRLHEAKAAKAARAAEADER